MRRQLAVLAAAFVITLPLITPRIYASDEVQYFAYLRSLWFDHDVSFENEYQYFYDRGIAKSPYDRERGTETRGGEVGRKPVRMLGVARTADHGIEGGRPVAARDVEAVAEQQADRVEPAREQSQIRKELRWRGIVDPALARGIGMNEPRKREVAGEPRATKALPHQGIVVRC